MAQLNTGIIGKKWYPLAILGVLALLIAGVWRTATPSEPLGIDAPKNVFSSARAFADLTDLIKENTPHPAGSAANKVIKARIVEKIQARGFTVEIQSDTGCFAKWNSCANVENIIALKKGKTGKSTLLVMSHYDSVPASAAAGDDGLGVAAMLEVASILQGQEALDNDLIFLFTDAEELGLNGASAFAANHPLADKVSMIINIEARGTSGHVAMFETGADNNRLLDIYQSGITRPLANSLTSEVYRRMPNDTDYSVFREKGIPGINFASSRSASRYHSVFDDLDHLDKGTLQQHGNNVLTMVRAFGNEDLTTLPNRTGDATYFDLFSAVLIKWPSSINTPLSIFAFVAMVSLIAVGYKSQTVQTRTLLWAAVTLLFVIIAVIGVAALLAFPLGIFPDLHPMDNINQWPGSFAAWAGTLLGISAIARLTKTKVTFHSQLLVSWLLIAIISIALSVIISGASYIALAPLMAFAVGFGIDAVRARFKFTDIDYLVSAHLGFIGTAYMGLYHFLMLDIVLNFDLLAPKTGVVLPMAFALLPLLQIHYLEKAQAFKVHQLILGASIIISTIVAMQIPGFSKDKPDPLNIIYVEDWDKKEAYWTLEHYLANRGEPSKYFSTMGFPAESSEFSYNGHVIEKQPRQMVDYQALPAPTFTIVSDTLLGSERVIEADIKSGHAGYSMTLMFGDNAPITGILVNGVIAHDASAGKSPVYLALGATQGAIYRVKLTLKNSEPFAITLYENTDLADSEKAQEYRKLRPEHANEIQEGDRSIVLRKIQL